MAIVQTSIPEVNDIVDNAAERELWIVGREHERAPFWAADEGLNSRLGRALRVVQEGHVTPNADGSFTVVGREGHSYRVLEHCSCPDGTYRKERPCYHQIAVTLYVEWQRRLGFTPQGLPRQAAALRAEVLTSDVDEETPLPLPPVTVDERLAAPGAQEPLGAFMPTEAYIPEPTTDNTPVAVLERPAAIATRSRDAQALADSMTAWREQRTLVTQYIKEQLVENVDYYSLRIKGRDTKPTLSKAGAEKFLAILRLSAAFTNDEPTWRMLGAKEGTLCYVCTLTTREGQVVGEGRGARSISQDGGDINKAIKMSEKSALIDAVLRTGCLSDCFTQDIGEPQEAPPAPTPARPSSSELRSRIWSLVKETYPDITSRDECEAYIKDVCGLDLTPDNYAAILKTLEGR